MPFAIIRTAKLSSFGNIGSSASHNFRTRFTANADPTRRDLNRTWGAQSPNDVQIGIKQRLSTVPTVRKNAVLTIEYMISASPEWFLSNSPELAERYLDSVEKWLKQRHGIENVISVTRHRDEKTPHICAYVVPIDPRGRLNCSFFLDGRLKLSQLQTDFAEQVGADYGLQRGLEGSTAKHTTLKEYYAKIQLPAPATEAKAYQPSGSVSRQLVEKERLDKINAQQEVQRSKAIQFDIDLENKVAFADSLAKLRATSTTAVDLPLPAVLQKLGCYCDANEVSTWRTPIGPVIVDGIKFRIPDLAKEGRGAIQLVEMVADEKYKDAYQWLGGTFGFGSALSQALADLKRHSDLAAKDARKAFNLPRPSPENWAKAREYLVKVRNLGNQEVDELHQKKKLYADKNRNCIFVLDSGLGVEIHGTGAEPYFGIRGSESTFSLSAIPGEKTKIVAFVGSAIDVLSLRCLGFRQPIVSVACHSTNRIQSLANQVTAKGYRVIAYCNKDKEGKLIAESLNQYSVCRSKGKSWTDDLVSKRKSRSNETPFHAEGALVDSDDHGEHKSVIAATAHSTPFKRE
ncbi:MAG TPA: MobV family relaxase [Burkholderiaceae bacterium]|nr:MobV family relaxase [Burkholderiaceae bacterium]